METRKRKLLEFYEAETELARRHMENAQELYAPIYRHKAARCAERAEKALIEYNRLNNE